MTLNWYSHKTKTQRRHRDGRGFWSKTHILDGPQRKRIEGERVRFICGHETDSLTMPVVVGGAGLEICRSCINIASSRNGETMTDDTKKQDPAQDERLSLEKRLVTMSPAALDTKETVSRIMANIAYRHASEMTTKEMATRLKFHEEEAERREEADKRHAKACEREEALHELRVVNLKADTIFRVDALKIAAAQVDALGTIATALQDKALTAKEGLKIAKETAELLKKQAALLTDMEGN